MKQDPIEYLYSLQRFGIKLGLERMQKFMKLLSNPHTKFPSIHVTGTNGKGSVCAYLAKVLEEAGYKVGLYTSPHLVKFNERIQINGKQITDTKIAELVEYIKTNVADAHTTFFEFTTALAFVYFAQENVDIAIIEVGLGGNLDATTVITPLVSVITNISLDHTKILGETNLQIAEKKAGVIKKKIPLVTGEKDPAVLKMFETKCQELATEVIPTSSYTILENCNGLQKFEFLNS